MEMTVIAMMIIINKTQNQKKRRNQTSTHKSLKSPITHTHKNYPRHNNLTEGGPGKLNTHLHSPPPTMFPQNLTLTGLEGKKKSVEQVFSSASYFLS